MSPKFWMTFTKNIKKFKFCHVIRSAKLTIDIIILTTFIVILYLILVLFMFDYTLFMTIIFYSIVVVSFSFAKEIFRP